MRNLCKLIGLLSIAATSILPIAFFFEYLSLVELKQGLFIATLLWFGTSLFWIGRKEPVYLGNDE